MSWQVVQVFRLLKSQHGGTVLVPPATGLRSPLSSSTRVSRFSMSFFVLFRKALSFRLRSRTTPKAAL